MPPLAEAQTQLRAAVVDGDAAPVAALLVGGAGPLARLAVHQRHYHASLIEAVLQKFPATVWFAGAAFIAAAARAFVRQCPPRAPCIAEYAEDFPDFIAVHPQGAYVPCLRWLAALDWHLGQVSIAIDTPALTREAVAAVPAAALVDATLRTQPGVRLLEAPYPVDRLMECFLRDDDPPDRHPDPETIRIELRGARGTFTIRRLDAPAFAFRRALVAGESIGGAAEAALAFDPAFDFAGAFASVIAEGLATAIQTGDRS
jgi:hypothetical protein